MQTGFVYSDNFNQYNFGKGHPLTPKRIELTFSLMKAYGLLSHPEIDILTPRQASEEEALMVHTADYVNMLKELSHSPMPNYHSFPEYGLGPGDNPIFPNMYDAALAVSGASITAAEYILQEDHTRAFNIMGGLHHSMPNMASGFCIFNDIAIAIKYLKKNQPNIRIMYLDIDAHHGDGVQWIFYDDPSVLKLSFHQDGHTIFPGTGNLNEIGENEGRGYTLNFPLPPMTYDSIYLNAFNQIVPKVMEAFSPDLLLLQSGVDTHYLDPITNLGLSTEGHEKIFKNINENVRKYCNNKLLAVGGGGYNISVVARSWSMFLAELLGTTIEDPLPSKWIQEFEETWSNDNEPTPDFLRDRNIQIEARILKNPYWHDEIETKCDQIIEKFEKDLIPMIKISKKS